MQKSIVVHSYYFVSKEWRDVTDKLTGINDSSDYLALNFHRYKFFDNTKEFNLLLSDGWTIINAIPMGGGGDSSVSSSLVILEKND